MFTNGAPIKISQYMVQNATKANAGSLICFNNPPFRFFCTCDNAHILTPSLDTTILLSMIMFLLRNDAEQARPA